MMDSPEAEPSLRLLLEEFSKLSARGIDGHGAPFNTTTPAPPWPICARFQRRQNGLHARPSRQLHTANQTPGCEATFDPGIFMESAANLAAPASCEPLSSSCIVRQSVVGGNAGQSRRKPAAPHGRRERERCGRQSGPQRCVLQVDGTLTRT
jgi:hypothetical protein